MIIFEDPCPQPGRGMKDFLDRLLKEKEENKRRENKASSWLGKLLENFLRH